MQTVKLKSRVLLKLKQIACMIAKSCRIIMLCLKGCLFFYYLKECMVQRIWTPVPVLST